MTLTNQQAEQLAILLGELLNDSLSEERRAELSTLLESSPAARDYYLDYMSLHAQLEYRHTPVSDSDSNTNKEPTVAHPPTFLGFLTDGIYRMGSYIKQPTPLSVATAIVVMIAGIWVLMQINVNQQDQPLVADSGDEFSRKGPIAKLNFIFKPQWKSKDTAFLTERLLIAGEKLELASGIVEVDFNDGSSVILEGPTSFELLSPSSGRLHVGKITAKTTPGFVVEAATSKIIDLGTAFGVELEEQGDLDVVVYQGRVELLYERIEGEEKTFHKKQLTTGQRAHLPAQPEAVLSIASLDSKETRAPIKQGLFEALDGLLTEKLLAYYPLDNKSGQVAKDAFGKVDGKLVNFKGKESTNGKINRSLKFTRAREQYLSIDPLASQLNEEQGFTFACWFKMNVTEAVKYGYILFSANDETKGNILRLGIEDTGGLFYGVNTFDEKLGGERVYQFNANANDNRWHLLTVTFTGETTVLFLDAKRIGATEAPVMKFAKYMSVGQEYDNITLPHYPSDFFEGRIDEVALWQRTLSPKEIRLLYYKGLRREPVVGK